MTSPSPKKSATPKRKTLREQQKLVVNEFTLPDEVLAVTAQQNLVVVLDKRPPVRDAFGTWIRVTHPGVVDGDPDRYVLYTEAQTLRADLMARNLYPSVSPKGFVKFRVIPVGVVIDWETGEAVISTPTA